MEETPLKFIQISDIHLLKDNKSALLGVTTFDSFQAILKEVKKNLKGTDFFILSGDLSQDASIESYQKVAEGISQFKLPAYYVLGNHDDFHVISQVYPLDYVSNQRVIISKQWQIILLNSQKTGAVEGYLPDEQFEFLAQSLESYPEHHALIVFHHHPIPIHCGWLDPLGLTNADELWEFLKHYPQVRAVLFGHIHQEHEGRKNGIYYASPPSTCIQFKPKTKDFQLDSLPQGYRWVELYPNGQFKTGIHRLAHYVGNFDPTAKGY